MIGPDIPEHLIKKKQEEKTKEIKEEEEVEEKSVDQDEEEDIADAFMPELPPDLLPAQPKKKRVMGPAFPPPSSSVTDYQQEDDEDDIVGPSLPTDYDVEQASLNSTVAAIEERARQSEEAMISKDEDKDKDKKVERAEWMLAPPDVDYLKNANSGRPRSFNQRSVDNSKRDTSAWTDTPADKARKQQQQHSSSSSSKSSSSSRNYNDTRSIKQDLETHKKIQEHNDTERPMSLLEMHRQNKKTSKRKLDEDDPRQRPFDREKDLVSARPMSKKQKAELLQKSNEWSDRFNHSRGSTFL